MRIGTRRLSPADIPVIGSRTSDDIEANALADPAWGSSQEERKSSIARASKRARYVSIGGYALAIGGIFFPKPYGVWIGSPGDHPIALFVWTISRRGRWALRSTKEDFRPQVGDGMAMPAIALLLRTLMDLHFSDTGYLLITSFLAALGAVAVAYTVARSGPRPRVTAVLILLVAGIWSFGAIGETDVLLDHGLPTATHRVPIVRKDVSHGKTTTYSRNNARLAGS